ncbi:MAG: hypothetical protein ACJ75F_11270 [Flavisolibacter sp.]|jgi:HPt (histidine-containing phosphotransfer) domain-containing protein
MEKKVFDTTVDLDSTFLEAVYENDRETAAAIFQQYLHELPGDLHSINESFESGDKKLFLSVIHKKKVGFSYVGLTDVTARMNDLESKCVTADNLQVYQSELKSVIDRINASTEAIQMVLKRLQQQEI